MTDNSKKFKSDLAEKKFEIRDSLLTNINDNKNVRVFYHLVISYFIILTIKNAINDIYYNGGSQFGFRLIILAFTDIHIAIGVWCILFVFHLLVFLLWHIWALRLIRTKAWNISFACVGFLVLFGPLHWAATLRFAYNISYGCATIILAEQTRFIMKGYAFISTNTRNVLEEGHKFRWPKFTSYLYFSFAPTLIYRNKYPMVETRSWSKICEYALKIFATIYALSLLENEFILVPLKDFGKLPFGFIDVIFIWLSSCIHAFYFFIIFTQIITLHLWQNAFAELMKFGDRQFYKEWWVLSNYKDFYVNWNTIVQDWLFMYIYMDFKTLKNKKVARLAVLFLSVVIHEVMLTYVAKFAFPVFVVGFFLGFLAVFLPDSNLLVFLLFIIGTSFLVTMTHLEYFAIQNCPNKPDSMLFLYLPKMFSCHR